MTETAILVIQTPGGAIGMEEENNVPGNKRGALGRVFDWTVVICLCTTIVGLTWKYIVKPLFFGG